MSSSFHLLLSPGLPEMSSILFDPAEVAGRAGGCRARGACWGRTALGVQQQRAGFGVTDWLCKPRNRALDWSSICLKSHVTNVRFWAGLFLTPCYNKKRLLWHFKILMFALQQTGLNSTLTSVVAEHWARGLQGSLPTRRIQWLCFLWQPSLCVLS